MEIIAELEDSRGACTAAPSASSPRRGRGAGARFSVPIRTVLLDAQTGTAEYGVGGGITWGSRAASEFDETVAKARVLTARRPRFELYETLRHDPGNGFLPPRAPPHPPARLGATSGSRSTRRASCRRLRTSSRSARPARPAPRHLRSPGRVTAKATALPPSPQPVRLAHRHGQPVDHSDPMMFHKNCRRGATNRRPPAIPTPTRCCSCNDRGEITEARSPTSPSRSTVDG